MVVPFSALAAGGQADAQHSSARAQAQMRGEVKNGVRVTGIGER
jgi:hypothetical protein